MTVEDKVRDAVCDLFSLTALDIANDTSVENVDAWVSMQDLNLIWTLEQLFGCSFSPEEIAEMTSVEKIIALVSAKVGPG